MKKLKIALLLGICAALAAGTVSWLSRQTVSEKFSTANNSVMSEVVFGDPSPSHWAPPTYHAPQLTSRPLKSAAELSTFAADVDTASFTLARSALQNGYMPSSNAIRVEEFLNYFHYDYPQPPAGRPAAVRIETAPSPVDRDTMLMSIGIQAGTPAELPPVHLTFLVDVSGSMSWALPLAKLSMQAAVARMRPQDRVAIVTYSGSTEVVLASTSAAEARTIVRAIDGLNAAGGTAMGAGMQLAYDIATRNAGAGRVSHVMVMSDGDANIGARNPGEILDDIRSAVADGVTLSTVGFGNGAYNDRMMEGLANAGNGNYIYVDTEDEVANFTRKLQSMLHVIAKDVKIQVEFDTLAVASWRQIGYENRQLAAHEFRDDRVDAGEIGVGHQVTALYEVKLRSFATSAQTLATARFRYKEPTGSRASEVTTVVRVGDIQRNLAKTSDNFRFQTAVALFAQGLATQSVNKQVVADLVQGSIGDHPERRQILTMLQQVNRPSSVASTCQGVCF